jgi:competence protein ComEA
MTENKAKLLRRFGGASIILIAAALVTVAYAGSSEKNTTRTFAKPARPAPSVAKSPPQVVRLAEAPKASQPSKQEPVTQTKSGKLVRGVVNINTADSGELQRLPGVGLAKAQRIVDWRKQHGSFKRVVDLRRVKGFGQKSVAKLQRHLAVSGPTTLRKK